jgi:nucleoside-diphosphate-sugar epimerase
MTVLVTGGSGYFGETLCRQLLAAGEAVRVLDLNPPGFADPRLECVQGDIRDPEVVAKACRGIRIVHHNVAQVPLAKDRHLFWSVNHEGMRILLQAARQANVGKVVYTSSSAVFGIPKSNPVTEETTPAPAEEYGRAKLAGEKLCHEAVASGLDVSIIRPRTILGHGRLGIVQILFDWIMRGRDVPVFDGGRNIYQFVHADDLAAACIAAGNRAGPSIYNIGAGEFGTMAETLGAVIRHAGTGSRLRSVPMTSAQFLMRLAEYTGLSPLGPYHALMFGRSLYFDTGKAERELGWRARYSNAQMICESYDWYKNHMKDMGAGHAAGRSHHQSPVKQNILALVPPLLQLFPEASA